MGATRVIERFGVSLTRATTLSARWKGGGGGTRMCRGCSRGDGRRPQTGLEDPRSESSTGQLGVEVSREQVQCGGSPHSQELSHHLRVE